MRKLYISVLILTGFMYANDAKVVYDLTTGDQGKIEKHLIKGLNATSEYYRDHNRTFKAIVVISGNAYRYFVDDLVHSPYANEKQTAAVQKSFKTAFAALHKYGVVFEMCSNGMKKRKISKKMVYHYVQTDKIKNVYLIDAQNDGYAYLPIH